jgi:hypothetical protein
LNCCVENVEVIIEFNGLLTDGLALELVDEIMGEIARPVFKKYNDTTHKEEPDAPTKCTEANAQNHASETNIEVIVDEVERASH